MAPRKNKTMPAPDDLGDLDVVLQRQEAGIVVQLVNYDGHSPLGFGILIAGPDSEQAIQARNQMTSEIRHILEANDVDDITPEQREPIELRFLARVSKEFVGPAKLDKVLLTNTEQDFLKLYKRFRFIRLQMDRAHADRSRFLPEPGDESSMESSDASPASGSESQDTPPAPGTVSGSSEVATST